MRHPIYISTGCLHSLFNEDRNKIIEALKKFSFSGIELSFAYPEYLLDFNITEKNLDYLRSLKFISIHSPDMDYGQGKAGREILDKISDLYKQTKAKHVVFHQRCIFDYELVLNSDFVSSIENEDWRFPKHKIEDIKDVLNRFKEFKFTFDFAHALSVSSLDVADYINFFKDRLIEIHISFFNKETEKHDFLYKYDSQEIRELLKPLKKVSVPLVLEAAIDNFEDIKLIEKEVQYLQKV